ncbi:MAG: phage protein NinX family protein [Hafnia sp.]
MTNEEINALSDQQINVMMTISINEIDERYIESVNKYNVFVTNNDKAEGVDAFLVYDYCNAPSVMWPIISHAKIDIMHRDALGIPCAVSGDILFADNNPLRAAAIVYLKMNGVL